MTILQWSIAWADKTNFHPVAMVLVGGFVLHCLVTRSPERVGLGLLAVTCLLTVGQRVVVGGFDMTSVRILLVFGWLRLIWRGEITAFRFRPLDYLVIAWCLVGAATFVLQKLQVSPAAVSWAATNRLGWLMDHLGAYLLFRICFRSWEGVIFNVKFLALVVMPATLFFLWEKITGSNLFASFGGVEEVTLVRNGRRRCQGPFSHAILAGCFWSSLVPLFLAMWTLRRRQGRAFAIIGVSGAFVIVFCTASSTPVIGTFFALVATTLYAFRNYMRFIQAAMILVPIGLHMVMEKPVWHLLARINVVSGSTGWHRYVLIDAWLAHFHEWWLCGVETTEHWGMGLIDVTNHYVAQAVGGGLVTLLLFLAVLFFAFKACGDAMRAAPDGRTRFFVWQIGACLFVHCLNFMAVTYVNKPDFLLIVNLALIAAIDQAVSTRPARPLRAPPTADRQDTTRPTPPTSRPPVSQPA